MKQPFRHKLLFWPVGILSLGVLPIILGWHVQYDPAFREQTCFELNLFPHDTPRYVQFKRLQLIGPEGHWKYFQMPKNPEQQIGVLDSIHRAIRNHASTRDTIFGIRISLQRETPYESFIQVLDWLNCEGVYRYVVEGSDIWVSRFLESSEREGASRRMLVCGGIIGHVEPARLTHAEIFQQMLSGYSFLSDTRTYPTAILLAVAWGGILLLNIYRVRQRQKRT